MDKQTLDPKRQIKAKEYARIQRRFLLFDLVLGVVLLLVWLLSGWSAILRDWIYSWTQNQWLAVIVYGAVFGGMFYLLDLPLSYYTGFILPHRFEQSNQTLKGWWGDLLKSTLLSAVLGGFLLEIVYLGLRVAPDSWWLWTAGFLFLFNVLLSNLAPVLLFPIFNKFSPLDEEHLDLQERLIKLADQAGTKVEGVYKFDMSRRTKAANAGLTGLGNTRRIILGDTLVDEFSSDEIETVLAHELGHQANHDILLSMVVQTGITLGGLYLTSRGLSWAIFLFGFSSVSDIAALPIFGLSLGAFGLLTMPLSNGFSRWRERLADDFALQLTGKGQIYASALMRLGNQNLAEVDPDPWVEFLLYSHPSLEKRILKAQSFLNQSNG